MTNCWVVTDGNTGARSQAIGLAEALGISFIEKTFRLKKLFRLFAPYIPFNYLKFKTSNSSEFKEKTPPEILIVCGNSARSIGPLFKRRFGNNIFTIYIQDPRMGSSYYDLIIAPKHDPIKGPNVIKTNFSLNRVNQDKLQSEYKKFASIFKNLAKPHNVLLVGGNTKKYKMDTDACRDFDEKISYITNILQGSLLITPSRRTPQKIIKGLEKIASTNKNFYLYDLNNPENPYFAMLETADNIFITNDSVSMLSEACATNKTVFIIPLKGNHANKIANMFNALIGAKEIYDYKEFLTIGETPKFSRKNETLQIANKVKTILKEKNFIINNA